MIESKWLLGWDSHPRLCFEPFSERSAGRSYHSDKCEDSTGPKGSYKSCNQSKVLFDYNITCYISIHRWDIKQKMILDEQLWIAKNEFFSSTLGEQGQKHGIF